jgi:DNA-binding MarR family transcriptional regulator
MVSMNHDLGRLSFELSRILRRHTEHHAPGHEEDVSILRAHALASIQDKGQLSLSMFAASMRISLSSASAFVDRLVHQGLVRRAQDQSNRRSIRIQITDKGKRMLVATMERKKRAFSSIFSVLSPADQSRLSHILQRVVDAHCSPLSPS